MIYENASINASFIAYLIGLTVCIAVGVVFGVVIPKREGKGRALLWLKELPLPQKLLYFVLPLCICAIGAVFFLRFVVGYTAFYVQAASGTCETEEISTSEQELSVIEAPYRGEHLGYNLVFQHNGKELRSVTVFSDQEINAICSCKKVRIEMGFLTNDGTEMEVWKIYDVSG